MYVYSKKLKPQTLRITVRCRTESELLCKVEFTERISLIRDFKAQISNASKLLIEAVVICWISYSALFDKTAI